MKNLAALAVLLIVEVLIASMWLDGASLSGRTGIPGQIGIWGAWILRAAVVFAVAFAAFAGMQGTLGLSTLREELGSHRTRWRWIYVHAALACAFAVLSSALYGNWSGVAYPNTVAIAWLGSGFLAVIFACAAFIPWSFWRALRERTGAVWMYAAVVSVLAVASVRLSQSLWESTAQLTFRLVELLVRPVFPGLIADPAGLRLTAPHFAVIIDERCSGLEGVGLMLIFVCVWLILFRKDFKLPRSLVLLAVAPLVLYLLNAVRIAALLMIGNAGAKGIAAGGFHSQAGWIAFNGVAFAMTVFIPRVQWFRSRPLKRRTEESAPHENATAAYLLPFLAILAAGMLSRAMSANFEWLYVLRLVAAFAVLWATRASLRKLDWRFGWAGPAAGVAVFVMWVGLDAWRGTPASPMPPALFGASVTLQVAWIVLRAIAATTTVPIAEELAFRGFLMRRFQSEDFESIALSRASAVGVILSSVAFGLLHGERWVAGIVAGLLYAITAKTSNRIGEPVAAHATTNLLLAAWVLVRGQWQYW